MPVEATVLVEEPPKFELRGGLFYVTYEHGPVRAYRPRTFFAAIADAAATGREFKFGGAEIVPITKNAAG